MKRREFVKGALFAALLAAGAAFGSAEETTPVPRQSEDTWGWWKRCGDRMPLPQRNLSRANEERK